MSTTTFTANAMKVLEARYLSVGDDGHVNETPFECFRRVANAISASEPASSREHWSNEFYAIMSSLDFLPGGRTISTAGTSAPLVSNCVVLHVEDSLEHIFQTLTDACVLHKGGSGVGFPFHLLRPAGTKCRRTLGESSGPVSFMRIFSESFRPILSHGRESANMGLMSIDHPDILEFLSAKSVEGSFSNFNFSVGLTDAFMKCALDRPDDFWLCEWSGHKMKPRTIKRDDSGRVLEIKEVDIKASDLLDRIVEMSWHNGEPGCVFIDTVNRSNPLPGLGPLECCNPCGEQFLHDGDACNLGAINLERFVTSDCCIDFDRLDKVTRTAVRFLDDVIDQTQFEVSRVHDTFTGNRRIGLGIMGLADMLFLMGLAYDSDAGRSAARSAMKCISDASIDESHKLGCEKGSFDNFEKSKWFGSVSAMRNASLTNVAPCGSISIICDVSSGVEPYFALAYKRMNCLDGSPMEPFVNKHLKHALESCGCYTDSVMEKVLQTGSLSTATEVPEEVRRVFVTSLDISARDHCHMQATIQEYCCNAISKSINFRNQATVQDIKDVFIQGWRSGVKGMTVYRNGSRESQVLVTNSDEPVQTSLSGCRDGKCDV